MTTVSPDQIKELTDQISRIEQQLNGMAKDIKQTSQMREIRDCRNQSSKFNPRWRSCRLGL
jgi:uncharacterized protein (UPF0335 family)